MGWIAQYWIEFAFGLLGQALTAAIRYFYKRVKYQAEEGQLMKQAVLALLDHEMGKLYQDCRKKKGKTREEARRYERLYSAYHQGGGNGAVTNEHDQFQDIEIVEDN